MLEKMLKSINDIPNLLEKINAVSDIIHHRPKPIRKYDQIYMNAGNFTYYLELLDKFVAGKSAIFVGDGDGGTVQIRGKPIEWRLIFTYT